MFDYLQRVSSRQENIVFFKGWHVKIWSIFPYSSKVEEILHIDRELLTLTGERLLPAY